MIFEGTYPRETGDDVIDRYPLAFGTSHATAWITSANFVGCVMYYLHWVDISAFSWKAFLASVNQPSNIAFLNRVSLVY